MAYEVRVKSVVPKSAGGCLENIPRCYLGVSLGQEVFGGEQFSAILDWLAAHARECRILVGDDLHRINLMIWEGLSERDALVKGRQLGETFKRQCGTLLHRYPGERFSIVHWKELTSHPDFSGHIARLNALLEKGGRFHDSVRRTAEDYLGRLNRLGCEPEVSHEKAVTLSLRYILEEIAVFAVLASDGWRVDVYPGPELPVLVEVARGEHEGVPEPLRDRVNVELFLRPAASLPKAM